jgi:hypothetical protein
MHRLATVPTIMTHIVHLALPVAANQALPVVPGSVFR